MSEYKIELKINNEKHTVDINGQVFDILQNNVDTLDKRQEMTDYFNKYKTNPDLMNDVSAVTDMINRVAESIEDVIGKGAINKIMNGKKMSVSVGLKLMAELYRVVDGIEIAKMKKAEKEIEEYNEKTKNPAGTEKQTHPLTAEA